MKISTYLILLFSLNSIAFGQVTASSLHSMYGVVSQKKGFAAKELLIVRPGLAITVVYGPHEQACRIEIPAGKATRKQVDEIIKESVPSAARGRKWNYLPVVEGTKKHIMNMSSFMKTYLILIMPTLRQQMSYLKIRNADGDRVRTFLTYRN